MYKQADFKRFLDHHFGVLAFGGIGIFVIITHYLQPVPVNVTSYTDQWLYGLPVPAGMTLVFLGIILDTVNSLFDE